MLAVDLISTPHSHASPRDWARGKIGAEGGTVLCKMLVCEASRDGAAPRLGNF
jgi:hypothetical protein